MKSLGVDLFCLPRCGPPALHLAEEGLLLSGLGQPGSIPVLMLSSGGMAFRHRNAREWAKRTFLDRGEIARWSLVRTRTLPLDLPCLGLGNLTVAQPSTRKTHMPYLAVEKLSDSNVKQASAPLTIQGEVFKVVEHFPYLGGCIGFDCSVADEANARICKGRVAFSNFKHLWRQSDVPLNLNGRVCQASMRTVLLYV
ncbi:hypothetical protein CSKR_112265 [Clonorchis sinensis]|uniref:Uncharacterized protein n=1 Tax=Clonorchis sinensis TaxID=79923 RepID=A0A419Q7K2_CLOSI|nr:hypothetical protein CSKR_112265 [Clonorchis sinensis]